MLGQLDAREVSRFAARYFFVVDDGSVEEEIDSEYSTSRKHLGGDSSRFGSICATGHRRHARRHRSFRVQRSEVRDQMRPLISDFRPLACGGDSAKTRHAAEIVRPTASSGWRPFPSPGATPGRAFDAWLAENIDNRQRLDIGHSDAAEIGATAAAVLLERHHEKPGDFGLQLRGRSTSVELQSVRLHLYARPITAQRVRKWWISIGPNLTAAANVTYFFIIDRSAA